MTARDFCFWLQGYFEVAGVLPAGEPRERATLTPEQVTVIRQHLALVFKHEIDPSMGPPEHQADLNKIHEAIGKVAAKIDAHVSTPHGRPDLVMRC